jgi:hypothetical protein
MTHPFARPDVARVCKTYPAPMRRRLIQLRQLILDTAARLDVGRLDETLRWGEPAYVFDEGDRAPVRALTVCITAALTYHRPPSRSRSGSRRA